MKYLSCVREPPARALNEYEKLKEYLNRIKLAKVYLLQINIK